MRELAVAIQNENEKVNHLIIFIKRGTKEV